MAFRLHYLSGQEIAMPKLRVSSIPKRILLPIDFSPSSQVALEMAADLAKHFRAKLYLVWCLIISIGYISRLIL
jgi:hypothetical protein